MGFQFFDRDLSWLSFNGRVLSEAANPVVPLLERIRFLSIFSSNLDEFYRVRMPVILSAKKTAGEKKAKEGEDVAAICGQVIAGQLNKFGSILGQEILPALKQHQVHLVYKEPIPGLLKEELEEYFFSNIAAYLHIVDLSAKGREFFSENNQLYQVVVLTGQDGKESVKIIVVPSDKLPRFFSVKAGTVQYVLFLEDIIRDFIPAIFPTQNIKGVYNIKITRNADLNLEDEFAGDLAEKIEAQIPLRDLGAATRFLHEPGIALRLLQWLVSTLQLSQANVVEGGKYHNLRDFGAIPIHDPALSYPPWPPVKNRSAITGSLFASIIKKDRVIHTPYESYNTVLRFFAEAAIDPRVKEIFVTLYRIATDSKIAHSLITAARNGKKVVVFVELKARFDEENNIRWGKKMKEAGITIIYSIPNLKVHAKIALVKRSQEERMVYLGLLSTGNLNESTARFYTDHVLLTANHAMLRELELLFIFLIQKRKPVDQGELSFRHLLVAQFNLQPAFLELIDTEIKNQQLGRPSGIIIKMNNLEERKMISKLYEASTAGVCTRLIVRSICCLKPGQPGVTDNLELLRIVDRYLEHGRVFIFTNNGDPLVFLGSADWMNRNFYSRIEVCFPIHDTVIKQELIRIIQWQLADNVQAVKIGDQLENRPLEINGEPVRSQEKIYRFFSSINDDQQ